MNAAPTLATEQDAYHYVLSAIRSSAYQLFSRRSRKRELTERASEIDLKTITPSVEDASVLSVLWTLNVDFIQGNFLQEPQPDLSFDFSSM